MGVMQADNKSVSSHNAVFLIAMNVISQYIELAINKWHKQLIIGDDFHASIDKIKPKTP